MKKPQSANDNEPPSNACHKPKVNVVTTPLKKPQATANKPKFRDINEDDDGYHPYCDGPERGCQFERDPWD